MDVTFDHTVQYPTDGCTFGAAKETTGKTRIYLIFEATERVYHRNSRRNCWEVLSGSESAIIRTRAAGEHVKRYTCNSDSLANHI